MTCKLGLAPWAPCRRSQRSKRCFGACSAIAEGEYEEEEKEDEFKQEEEEEEFKQEEKEDEEKEERRRRRQRKGYSTAHYSVLAAEKKGILAPSNFQRMEIISMCVCVLSLDSRPPLSEASSTNRCFDPVAALLPRLPAKSVHNSTLPDRKSVV